MKRVLIPALLAFGLLLACAPPAAAAPTEPKKNGAGLIFITPDGSVLLLKRSGRHNTGKWALPGGNVEDSDTDLLAAAKREATEELGAGLPPYKIVGESILTRRGRSGEKHFTLFVARVTPAARAAYVPPNLDLKEHSQWKWFTLAEIDDLIAQGLAHPVVKKAFGRHRAAVLAGAGVTAPAAPGAGAAAAAAAVKRGSSAVAGAAKRGGEAAAVGGLAAAPSEAAAAAAGGPAAAGGRRL